jgi:general secretion pathway protein N
VRLDDAGPRTWLLATVAGWALAAWVLVLAGMGGRIAPLPDDAAGAQPLPRPAPAADAPLGPLPQYAQIGERPLFTTDRRPQPFSLQQPDQPGEQRSFEYVLTGVLLGPSLQMAVLQPAGGGEPERIRVGESPRDLGSWRLVELHPRSAVFEGPDGQQALDLRSWDGSGGMAPTAMRTPARDSAAGEADIAERPGQQGPAVVGPAMGAPPPPAGTAAEGETVATPEAQMDAIRRRIEARRAQLRREAEQRGQPVQPPPNKPEPDRVSE